MMSMPIEMITSDTELARAGFYWRAQRDVRALCCAPLERAGFVNAFSTRTGGVSPIPADALNLAGFSDKSNSGGLVLLVRSLGRGERYSY